jgi:hypothetical protein
MSAELVATATGSTSDRTAPKIDLENARGWRGSGPGDLWRGGYPFSRMEQLFKMRAGGVHLESAASGGQETQVPNSPEGPSVFKASDRDLAPGNAVSFCPLRRERFNRPPCFPSFLGGGWPPSPLDGQAYLGQTKPGSLNFDLMLVENPESVHHTADAG